VRSAGVQYDRLGLVNSNTHSFKVFHPPCLELLMNEKLPRAGLQDGLPRVRAGTDQLCCLLAIAPQIFQNDCRFKGVEKHNHMLVLFNLKGSNAGTAGFRRITVKGLGLSIGKCL
jgi:hypothetical protein